MKYNATNKKSFVHRANKNRTSESDIPAKFRVMKILKNYFGLIALTDKVIEIPDGHAKLRLPDLFVKDKNLVILLHGGIHGSGDEVSRRNKDDYAISDYCKAGCKVIEVYAEMTDNYSEDSIIQTFEFLGFSSK